MNSAAVDTAIQTSVQNQILGGTHAEVKLPGHVVILFIFGENHVLFS